MQLWSIFWTVAVLGAGLAFAFVTVVVTMKGGRDLRDMFARLLEQKKQATANAAVRQDTDDSV